MTDQPPVDPESVDPKRADSSSVDSKEAPPAARRRPATAAPGGVEAPARERLPLWKKGLLAAAAAVFLLGLLLRLTAGPAAEPVPGGGPAIGSALVEGGAEPGTEPGGAAAWSPGLMALGFSFFVGFAVGTLLRVFVKIAVVVAGLVFLSLAGLSYAELITVNWDAMDQIFSKFADRIGSDFDELSTIVTGRLPQAGLGVLGLVTGLKKR